MRGRGLTRRCGMGICYRATRHWRSHQKIVSCLERFPRTPRFARSQILRLSSRSGGPIIPFFYRKFWFAATVVKTSFLDIRSSVISLEEGRKKERSLSTGKEFREERVYLERLFSFFFFSRVYFELEVYTLSGVYLIIFLFSFFRIFTSFIVVCSLYLSLLAPWYRRVS